MKENMNEIVEAFNNLAEENRQLTSQMNQMNVTGDIKNQNNYDILRFELELEILKDKMKHLLRGDKIIRDEQGNIDWQPNDNQDHQLLNEYGAQEVMSFVEPYLDKAIILSNHGEEEIKDKVYDFGHRLNKLFYTKDYYLGLDTSEKIKMYPMLVGYIVDIVHSTYNRSINGETIKALTQNTYVHQNLSPQPQGMYMPQKKQGIFSKLNPFNAFR